MVSKELKEYINKIQKEKSNNFRKKENKLWENKGKQEKPYKLGSVWSIIIKEKELVEFIEKEIKELFEFNIIEHLKDEDLYLAFQENILNRGDIAWIKINWKENINPHIEYLKKLVSYVKKERKLEIGYCAQFITYKNEEEKNERLREKVWLLGYNTGWQSHKEQPLSKLIKEKIFRG